jgi:hypothetical protein
MFETVKGNQIFPWECKSALQVTPLLPAKAAQGCHTRDLPKLRTDPFVASTD